MLKNFNSKKEKHIISQPYINSHKKIAKIQFNYFIFILSFLFLCVFILMHYCSMIIFLYFIY